VETRVVGSATSGYSAIRKQSGKQRHHRRKKEPQAGYAPGVVPSLLLYWAAGVSGDGVPPGRLTSERRAGSNARSGAEPLLGYSPVTHSDVHQLLTAIARRERPNLHFVVAGWTKFLARRPANVHLPRRHDSRSRSLFRKHARESALTTLGALLVPFG